MTDREAGEEMHMTFLTGEWRGAGRIERRTRENASWLLGSLLFAVLVTFCRVQKAEVQNVDACFEMRPEEWRQFTEPNLLAKLLSRKLEIRAIMTGK